MSKQRALPLRLLMGFGRFWWDFLVGDTPEIFVTVVTALAVTALSSLVFNLTALAAVALPALVTVSLGVSVVRAVKSSRRRGD